VQYASTSHEYTQRGYDHDEDDLNDHLDTNVHSMCVLGEDWPSLSDRSD
jgi:hypothetical protein